MKPRNMMRSSVAGLAMLLGACGPQQDPSWQDVTAYEPAVVSGEDGSMTIDRYGSCSQNDDVTLRFDYGGEESVVCFNAAVSDYLNDVVGTTPRSSLAADAGMGAVARYQDGTFQIAKGAFPYNFTPSGCLESIGSYGVNPDC